MFEKYVINYQRITCQFSDHSKNNRKYKKLFLQAIKHENKLIFEHVQQFIQMLYIHLK